MSEKSTTQRPWRRGAFVPGDKPAVLAVTVGEKRGQTFTLVHGENLIGRHPSAQVQLDDSGVSREHAKLVWTQQGVFNLFDLRSTNGTALNGNLIDVAVLRPGDRIRIGPDVELWFGYEAPGADADAREDAAKRLRKLLSARQLQVAKLVAEGLSNREVGERLRIRARTVESHLDNIYSQLGINSRTALTRTIVEAGLLAREGPAQPKRTE